MRLIDSFKKKKFVLINIFLSLYISINLIGGDRGVISYLDKKEIYKEMKIKEKMLSNKIEEVEHKITLVKNNDLDFIDMLFREKFRYGTKDEIIIKIK